MYYWYKLITYVLYPLAPIYLYFRKLKKKENLLRYKEKLSQIDLIREDGFLIWLHVASVGEAMSVLPIIESLNKDEKINKILLTSITLSSGKVIEEKIYKNKKIIHQFLPLDIPMYVEKFLKHWKPNLSVFVDSEIWPNLITQIKKNKIPLILLNARITKKTFIRWNYFKNFATLIFGKFDLCLSSNEETSNFLKILGAKNIKSFGNLKFSNVANEPNKNLEPLFLNKIKNRKVWCAASTHSSEELLCVKSHTEIKEKYKNVLTIVIPRHVDRVKRINKQLSDLNLKVLLSSKLDQIEINTDIILVDSYGETLKFYNISKCVFLGKSLIKSLKMDGGQNPIEPARLGCKIFHGPYVSNFTEIYKYLKNLDAVKEVNNYNELSASVIDEFDRDKDKNHDISRKIEDYGQNIFNNVIMELKKYI